MLLNYDLHDICDRAELKTVFDVGANVGQSAQRYLRWFPNAELYSFEPGAEAYAALRSMAAKQPRMQAYKYAVGSSSGQATMIDGLDSRHARVIVDDGCTGRSSAGSVSVVTLDELCEGQGISHIDFLKADTEGNDLEVLRGARGLLGRQAIRIIQVEVGMNKTNELHAAYCDVATWLADRGYLLFGIYDQTRDWKNRSEVLRRCDAVFVASDGS